MNDYQIAYILGNFMASFIIRKYFKVFCREGAVSKRYEAVAYVLYFVTSSLSCIYIDDTVVILATNFMLLCALSLAYLGAFQHGRVSLLIMYFSLLAIEIAVVVVSRYMVVSPQITPQDNTILASLLVRTMAYSLVQIIYSIYKMRLEFKVPRFYWMGIVLVPTSTVVLLLSFLSRETMSSFWLLCSLVCVFVINLSTFYLYEQLLKVMKSWLKDRIRQEQQKYYDHQLTMMKELLFDTRKLKHDIKNKLAPIYELEKMGRTNEAVAYISNLIDACFVAKEYASTGNVAIDSIINYKLAQAQRQGADITTEFYIPSDVEVEPLDMAVILGNLLDNAIEGMRTSTSEAELDLSMNYSKGRLRIVISNSFDGVLLSKGGKLHTRKQDALQHGIGLESVRDVLLKYDGIMDIEYIDRIFRVKVLLYL